MMLRLRYMAFAKHTLFTAMRAFNRRDLPWVTARLAVLFIGAVCVLSISGCGAGESASSSIDSFGHTGVISGVVHGGQFPIYNATVSIYAAGASGYGSSGGTALATTTTDAGGNFSFTKLATGTVGSGSSWSCPTSDPDPQIYLVSAGGNTQGTAVTTTNNTAAALVAAIGPCSTVSTSTRVMLNEITTAATVFALAQYINPGNGTGAATIGTNGANTATNTPQGALGLNNAVAGIANLANIAAGTAVTQNSYKGSNPTTATTTVTATPETARLITIANILAACINTTSSSSNQCVDLFANAVPPPVASVTSQPSATFAAAQDTIQAAYYMAVNPTNAVSNAPQNYATPGCLTTSSATTTTGCLFNLPTAAAPFQPGLTVQPTDWTIGVSYTSTSTCTSGRAFIASPFRSTVDTYGNLWFVSGYVASGAVSAMSPTGVPLFCAAITAIPPYYNGITIDTAGNIWASIDTSAATGGIDEIPAPGSVPTASTLSAFTSTRLGSTTKPPFSIVGDSYGNVFYTAVTASGGNVYEILAGTTTASTTASSLVGSSFSATNNAGSGDVFSRAADSVGRVYFHNNGSAAGTLEVTPPSAGITGYSITGGTITFSTSTAPGFTASTSSPQSVLVSGLTTLNRQQLVVTGVSSTGFSASTSLASTMGAVMDSGIAVVAPTDSTSYSTVANTFGIYGAAIDNNNYFYAGTSNGASTSPDDELLKATISPAGVVTTSANYSSSAQFVGGLNGARSVALDGADNVWFGNAFPAVDAATGESKIAGTWGVGEVYTSGNGSTAQFVALSPAATGLQGSDTCSNTSGCPEGGGFQKSSLSYTGDISIDPSGNVWALNTGVTSSGTAGGGTNITEIVGAAIPTVTPLSVAAANATLATKP